MEYCPPTFLPDAYVLEHRGTRRMLVVEKIAKVRRVGRVAGCFSDRTDRDFVGFGLHGCCRFATLSEISHYGRRALLDDSDAI